MRWLVGWSSAAARTGGLGFAGAAGDDGETLSPVGSQLLWGDPDPLWAVGDWRPDEIRLVEADAQTRIAVLGICGATDEQLRVGLLAARGGGLRHLTAWPGSYTAVVQVGRCSFRSESRHLSSRVQVWTPSTRLGDSEPFPSSV